MDPISAQMRQDLIDSRYNLYFDAIVKLIYYLCLLKRLNNVLSRAGVSPASAKKSSMAASDSPNSPSSLGATLISSLPPVHSPTTVSPLLSMASQDT